MSLCRDLGIVVMSLDRQTPRILLVNKAWLTSCLHQSNTIVEPGVCGCGNICCWAELSFVNWLKKRTYMESVHNVYSIALLTRAWLQYIHTQIRSVLRVSVLGPLGFGMCLDPARVTHRRTDLSQDVKRVWCRSFSFSHRSWSLDRTSHTVGKKTVARHWYTTENRNKKILRR